MSVVIIPRSKGRVGMGSQNGEGWKEFVSGVKKGVDWIKKNKPVGAIGRALRPYAGQIASIPRVGSVLAKGVDMAANQNAFGRKRRTRRVVLAAPAELDMIAAANPAIRPKRRIVRRKRVAVRRVGAGSKSSRKSRR